ncbi:hypothetical protein KC338_g287 [Hortaea werneckii]|nr:hypothetical protein KC338_g287 [Hortaea werneckii]
MLGSKGDVVVRMEVSGGDSDGPVLFQEVVDDRCDLTTAGDSQGARRRAKVVLPVNASKGARLFNEQAVAQLWMLDVGRIGEGVVGFARPREYEVSLREAALGVKRVLPKLVVAAVDARGTALLALVHESGKDVDVYSVLANPVSTTLHPSFHTPFFTLYLFLFAPSVSPVAAATTHSVPHEGIRGIIERLSRHRPGLSACQCWHDRSASVRRSHEAQKLPLGLHVLHLTPVQSDPREDPRLDSSPILNSLQQSQILPSRLYHCIDPVSPGPVQDRARSCGPFPYFHPHMDIRLLGRR